MVTIVGVRFRCAGKIYYFDPGEEQIARGTSVIVETARGTEMGTVVLPNKEVEDDSVVQPLKPILRIATPEDFAVVKANKEKEKTAYKICQEKIARHELEMKLVDVEYTFDGNKILFYFTADGRIDFRELVKDLASVFKTRIELRQIGVRDETKMRGGIGICGRSLCCSTYLSDFIPVSIRMAKEQNLSLNPTKISGVCGRLMCCLKNEEETYEYLNARLPSVGDLVAAKEDGTQGRVQSVNVLRQLVKVMVSLEGDEVEVREFPAEELEVIAGGKRSRNRAENQASGKEETAEHPETKESKPSHRRQGARREAGESRKEPEGRKNRNQNRSHGQGEHSSRERGARERSQSERHQSERSQSERHQSERSQGERRQGERSRRERGQKGRRGTDASAN